MDELWHCVAFENTGTIDVAKLREVAQRAFEQRERDDDDE